MNRKMKCRAWYKDEGEFLEVNKLYVWNREIVLVQDINEFEQETDPPLDVQSESLVLVWYTGLKDVQGTEIYEGDILSYFGFCYKVVYEKSAFGWYEDGNFYAFAEMAIEEISKSVVVGNCFENPELLEVHND